MKQRNKQGKTPTKARSKTRAREHKTGTIERKHQQFFTPHTLPFQGLYTDDDSLEQPSELKDVPTTSATNVEA